jgi:hypothetical protein
MGQLKIRMPWDACFGDVMEWVAPAFAWQGMGEECNSTIMPEESTAAITQSRVHQLRMLAVSDFGFFIWARMC